MSGHPDPTQDPEFYCHGQQCIDRGDEGCNPLYCKDEADRATADGEWEDI